MVLHQIFDPEDGLRFNFCRVPMGANDYALEWYSLNETDDDFAMKDFSIARDERILIPYINSAMAIRPDLKLFASPWRPPTWMKRPMSRASAFSGRARGPSNACTRASPSFRSWRETENECGDGQNTWGWRQNPLVTIHPETKAIALENPDGEGVVFVTNPLDEPRALTIGDGASRVSVTLDARSFNALTWKP